MKRLIVCLFSLAIVAKADERSLDDILRDGSNKFTAKMFTEVVKEKPGQSVVLSAFSVLTPLAQLALASVGESHDELLTSIGMPNDTVAKAVFSRVKTDLKSVKGVTLKTASKIYVAKNYELNNEFAALTKDIFGSEVANVDFIENEKTAKEVNLWIEEQTNNRIKDLVNPASLDDRTKALLINAIYFKGLWDIPFNKNATFDNNFHISKKKVIRIPTMYNKNNYRYIDSRELNAQVLELTYQGEESALYVLLPHEIDGITNLEEKLKDPSLLDNVINNMFDIEVEVFLPKFKIETTTDLKQILENMNVKKVFNSNEANLENLLKTVKSGLYISEAKQKAFIEVNEEGAEAAAANEFAGDRIFGGGPARFDANHPFIFLLCQGRNTLITGAFFFIVFEIVLDSLVINESPPKRFMADRPFYFVVREKTLSIFSGIFVGQ